MNLIISQTAQEINAKLEGRLDTAASPQFAIDMQPFGRSCRLSHCPRLREA